MWHPLGLDGQCDDKGNCTTTGWAPAPGGWWDLAYEGWPGQGSMSSFFCMLFGGCSSSVSSGSSGGGGGQIQPPAQPQPKPNPTNGTKQKVCSAIPSGRTTGVSAGVGGVGSPGGGGELVVNYNSGQVSAYAFGGVQVGWNGGISGSVYSGFVWGLNNSNSNYSGGFTGVNGGAGLGGFAASSSGGLTGGPSGLIPDPRGVTAGGVSLGAGLLGGFSGGVTATNYTNPAQLGKFWAFAPLDWAFYLARQACQ